MKTLVVLPSYNENQNINNIIDKILLQSPDNNVVVIDDNSPDNTIEIINKFIEKKKYKNRIHLIKRRDKLGRGSAVLEGLKWGYDNLHDLELFIEMDCDFSHSPDEILKGKELIKKYDFVIGARYPSGKIVNWPIKRRVFSFFANQLIRLLIDRRIFDYTNGFRFYSKKAINYLLQYNIKSSGHICLSEIAAILLKANFSTTSFPIIFINRVRGKSSVNFKEISRSLISIVRISWQYKFGKF
jgi:dolichol-phosphate mannosyltransferase|tara:strand:+ start:2215 stop:2940 length:726 start_codon:yes stop_codon:yes gene_type:complete